MAKPIAELEARLSKRVIEESDRLYAKLSEELALRDIREAAGLSQEEMAERLKVDQAQVSRIEKRDDARFSTVERYVRAAGGQLRVLVDMNGRIVELVGLTGARNAAPKPKKMPAKKTVRSRQRTKAKPPRPAALRKRA
jgi:transcriptional regulator with XRE-family HTH domain